MLLLHSKFLLLEDDAHSSVCDGGRGKRIIVVSTNMADEFQVMTSNVAAQVLGRRDPSNQEVENLVRQIRTSLDLRGTGSVQLEDILKALGRVTGKDLLQ